MYVLDTNVVSEITKPSMSDNVLSWFYDHDGLYLTSVTIMELNYGIMRLPEGKRKILLRRHIDSITRDCKDRILDFDSFSAYLCAELRCSARAVGVVPEIADFMIASICLRHNATLVTRNVKDFEYIEGLEIVDPFKYESSVVAELKSHETAHRKR